MELMGASFHDLELRRRASCRDCWPGTRLIEDAASEFIERAGLDLPVSPAAISAWISWFWIGMEASMVLGIDEKHGHQREALEAMTRLLKRVELRSEHGAARSAAASAAGHRSRPRQGRDAHERPTSRRRRRAAWIWSPARWLPRALPEPYPYETVAPTRDGFVERDGVRTWYAQFGDDGPWLVFAPVYQIANTHLLKGVVPWLSQHFRVVVMDLRGNGRSDRPRDPGTVFVRALLRRLRRRAGPAGGRPRRRRRHLGNHDVAPCAWPPSSRGACRTSSSPAASPRVLPTTRQCRGDGRRIAGADAQPTGRRYLDEFFGIVFNEPHSTKPYEDGVLRHGGATEGPVVAMGLAGWIGTDVREQAKQVRCPTLVIHGDDDERVSYANGGADRGPPHSAARGCVTVGGGGHLMCARDPVAFARAVRDFVAPDPTRSTWVRAMARKRRALFVSSAIGLGHVQRDLAIAREMRKLQPDLEIDWFTVHPASTYLEREGERLHPITQATGQREPPLRGPGRRARPAGLLRAAHDGRGDGAQLPGLRRADRDRALRHRHRRRGLGGGLPLPREPGAQAPALRLPDRLRRLPADGRGQRARGLPVRRPQRRRHRARRPLSVDPRPRDLRRQSGGRHRAARSARACRRSATGRGATSPSAAMRCRSTRRRWPTPTRCARRHGYRPDEKLVIAAVGGTAVGDAAAAPHRRGLSGDEAAGARTAHGAGRRPARGATGLAAARRAGGPPVCACCRRCKTDPPRRSKSDPLGRS